MAATTPNPAPSLDVRLSSSRRLPAALAVAVTAALVVSRFGAADPTTWLLETVWVMAGLPLIILFHNRFPLSGLLCGLLAAHALVLIVGGHYTYAEVPVGDWVRDWLGWERNPYDRFGHLMQGFVPAILVRELLVRTSPCAAAAGSPSSPSAPAWPSAPSSRCWNGWRPSPAARPRTRSWERRGTCGTPSGTCSAP